MVDGTATLAELIILEIGEVACGSSRCDGGEIAIREHKEIQGSGTIIFQGLDHHVEEIILQAACFRGL